MGFPSRYDAAEAEERWQRLWAEQGTYAFDPSDPRPIFAIDTPPPTVSGAIHIGHVYSYVQAEAMARFWRMQGYNVYYPFGFDDNGLPTERFVEQRCGITAQSAGRDAFITACLELSHEIEDRFEQFWKSLGMSVDWRWRYSTIDPLARRTSQWSFLDLYRKGLVYRAQSPNPWCIECQTAIAQAEMEDAERNTTFYTLLFAIAAEQDMPHVSASLPIATTRPELLPACVAVFVHPADPRFAQFIGQQATLPLMGRSVPILGDALVDPQKGTGAVMCCTFGDATDVAWWRTHGLPLIPLITRNGQLGAAAGPYAGLSLSTARAQIVADLRSAGLLVAEEETSQTIRIHERCGTPLEILETSQWFIRILDAKEALLEAGRQITWNPAHMHNRYAHWVANLNWDWCISRQRSFGVPFPVWYCDRCGAIILAEETQLPVDPATSSSPRPCACGNTELRPDTDVMDTWATSSLSPQIAARMLDDPDLYARLFPMQLRPQGHDIIRTWAFYTIVKSHYHFGTIPWQSIMICGHALDPSGRKLGKSKGNATLAPEMLIGQYGADAVRYWACGASLSSDQPVNTEAMKQGTRLNAKLWNAARFIVGRLEDLSISGEAAQSAIPPLQSADRALLAGLQGLIAQTTAHFLAYEYNAARDAVERFFWGTFCDNYLEWVKGRLYAGSDTERYAAQWTLMRALLTMLKLLAPIMPHITEEIYQRLGAGQAGGSIHTAAWPQPDPALIDADAEQAGAALLALTAAVRRAKSARNLSLAAPLAQLRIATNDLRLRQALEEAMPDLQTVTRAEAISFTAEPRADCTEVAPGLWAAITFVEA